MDEALGQAQRPGGEPDTAGRRELLHARRQVRGLAHRRVVHTEIAADRAHHDVTGVETHADLHLHAPGATQLVRVAPHGVLHPERGVARAHGVILVGERGAEERHDPVTHHLIHGALVVMNGVHHALENRIENFARLFGIAVAEQLHRALDVGEEHGHLLPLAFQCRPRGEDLLGEVLRSVGLRRGEARLSGGPVAHRRTAFVAEAGADG